MKKIISLTNVFIKEYYQNLPVFDTTRKKLNKRSVFFWLIAFIFFGVSYLSYESIKFLADIGQKEIFINMYFPILAILLAFQTILSCANIFFFSKDIEKVLHMPIKPIELLLSKMATLLCMLYGTEAVLTVVPIGLYGLMSKTSILYYFWAILIFVIFPIFIAVVISVLTLIIMRFAKFIRNKEAFQILTSIVLIITIFAVEFALAKNLFDVQTEEQVLEKVITFNDKIQESNELFLIVNPSIKILTSPASVNALTSFIKIIFYNIISIAIFIIIGNATYLKDILKNMVSIGKNKKKKTVRIKNKSHSMGITIAYISKEIKLLIRNPAFFMQCIFPVIILLISGIIITFRIWPAVLQAMQDENLKRAIENLTFNTEVVCDILIILQVLFSVSNISLTAISRDGNNATFIKYAPIDLYKQFIYKNIPQFVLNLLISVIVLILIGYILPSINSGYLLTIFAISIVINLINCYLMLIVDLRRPNLNWNTEEAVVKKSDNKFFQYALLIANVLLLVYMASLFREINIMIAMLAELLVYSIIFVIIDRCVNKWKSKLFDKIM